MPVIDGGGLFRGDGETFMFVIFSFYLFLPFVPLWAWSELGPSFLSYIAIGLAGILCCLFCLGLLLAPIQPTTSWWSRLIAIGVSVFFGFYSIKFAPWFWNELGPNRFIYVASAIAIVALAVCVARAVIDNWDEPTQRYKHATEFDFLSVTPLHRAVHDNDLNRATRSIAWRADVHAKDDYGQTPLHHAVRNNSYLVAELLLTKGAGVHAKDNSGSTPLSIARAKGHHDLLQLLKQSCVTRPVNQPHQCLWNGWSGD